MGKLAELEAECQSLRQKLEKAESRQHAAVREFEKQQAEFLRLKGLENRAGNLERAMLAEKENWQGLVQKQALELAQIKEFLKTLWDAWHDQAPDHIKEIEIFLKD